MRVIKINTNPTYNVLVRDGLLDEVGNLVNQIKSYDRIAVITDSLVEKIVS